MLKALLNHNIQGHGRSEGIAIELNGSTHHARHSHFARVRLPPTMLCYPIKLLRVGLALTLSLWIAGAGCMLGCQSMVVSAATHEAGEPLAEGHHLAMIVSGDACATTKGHDCCAKKNAEATKAKAAEPTSKPSLKTATLISQTESISPQPSGGMRDCPLALSRAVAVTKTSGGKQVDAPTALPLKALTIETSTEQHISLTPVARLPNRGLTYLRCCVFLI